MAEIFLSYASQDRERIRPLVEALKADGFGVWWDRNIEPGPSFDREIEQAIDASGCVVAAWSRYAVDSEWVRSEVDEGARRGILVPLRLDDALPPLAHRRRQTADLADWNGEPDDEYDKLVAGIRRTLAQDAGSRAGEGAPGPGTPRRRRRRTFGSVRIATFCVAAFCLGLAVAGAIALLGGSDDGAGAPEAPTRRFVIELPDGWLPMVRRFNPITVTPDGSHVVVNVRRGSEVAYLVRPLASLEATVVSDIGGVGSVWATPDADWILHNDFRAGRLARFRLPGGEREVVAELLNPNAAGGMWDESGVIVLGQLEEGIAEYDAVTGDARRLTTPAAGDWHIYPQLVDEGRKLLYVVVPEGSGGGSGTIRLLDRDTGEDRALFAGNQPLVTASGHLLFADAGAVWVTAFDAARGSAYGERVRLFESEPPRFPLWPRTHFAVSREGTLVHMLPDDPSAGSELGWLGLDGTFEPLDLPLDRFMQPRLDADDARIALVGTREGFETDVWVHHLYGRRTVRLTFDGRSTVPSWSADGQRVLFASFEQPDPVARRSRDARLFMRPADGSGDLERVTSQGGALASAAVPDGSAVVHEFCPDAFGDCDLALQSLADDSASRILLRDAGQRYEPSLSPDGRWLAFTVVEGDRAEVFVRPFPDVEGGRWQVSIDGGQAPIWGRGNDRLYYLDAATDTLMVVEYDGSSGFASTRPEPLIDLSTYEVFQLPQPYRNFDLDRTGERILISRARSQSHRLVVVVDAFRELERLAPTRH